MTGVGCSAEASKHHGPVLPRRVAEVLAQELGASVSWRCIGETGADVSMLRSRLLPDLECEVRRASDAGQRVDAVVVMTGLNDIKECFLFARPSLHPWRFGTLLSSLLGSIREVSGAHCSLLVAGCPIDAVPRFNDLWPLSSAVRGVTKLWEDQKRMAAETAQAARAQARQDNGGNAESALSGVVPFEAAVRFVA